jgi:predicted nucleic acid-binding protein
MKKIGLDTNFFMAIFLREEEKLDASARVLQLVADGVLTAIVSTITLVEIATLFCQKQEIERAKKAVEVVVSMQNTIFVDITAEIALPVANIKVSEKLSIADAMILAAAVEMSADAFLTFDSDFKKVTKIACMTPDEYLAANNLPKTGQ